MLPGASRLPVFPGAARLLLHCPGISPVADDRYSRQTLFSGIGADGQRRLGERRVLVVGAGALGAASLDMLVRAGVGAVRFVDRDTVELSNLQRQCLYDESDASEGVPKAEGARRRLARVNGEVALEPLALDLHAGNIREVFAGVDLALDATDNFETRYLLNDAAVALGIPWIYAACVGSYGMTLTIRPGRTGCLRCVIPEAPPPGASPTCDTAGVIAPAVHAVAAYAVAEALKLLAGREEALATGIWHLDVWERTAYRMEIGGPDPDCPACGRREFEFLDGDAGPSQITFCGRDAVQVRPPAGSDGSAEVDLLDRLRDRLEQLPRVRPTLRHSALLLQFEVEDRRLVVFPDGRAIVHGSGDPAEARTLVSRYIGS